MSDIIPPPKPLPADVVEIFEVLCTAAQTPDKLCVMGVRTSEGKPPHFIIGMVVASGMIPLAIIPSGLSITQYLEYFDLMASKVGGAELDPDFKGVRQ